MPTQNRSLESALKFSLNTPGEQVVNSYTQWGKLEELIVAKLPNDACFPPNGIDFHGECNNVYMKNTLPFPTGPKHIDSIKKANEEYD